MKYTPDFLMKPYLVHACEGLRPSDSDVYAVIYWFEKMRGEKCTASNKTIAEIARLQERTIRAALDRLEKNDFIERVYEDKERKKRTEIRTKVHMNKIPEDKKYAQTGGQSATMKKLDRRDLVGYKVEITSDIMKPGSIIQMDTIERDMKELTIMNPTPGEIAHDFFSKESLYREKILQEIADHTGAPMNLVKEEARKFFAYWTEPTKSGKKQLWETKPTFEIKRRLYTWFQKSNKYNSPDKKRTGAGVTI